jgi:hypothetical protein
VNAVAEAALRQVPKRKTQVHRFTGSQVHRFTGSQVHRFTGSQVHKIYSNFLIQTNFDVSARQQTTNM